ncbi:MAG: exodeoxyribonuclease III [Candidatus Lloydbacteria bacterium RIFCSPHIGHO2_01_FULL_41_20]|uniref:Exodeoxyribonuclease III n=1 Tax=Candidatus Lloydbacteria bacterium RIFCSPHIGHO2_01_FULL_41_20 TaxID=1798657 RepID=A0A1G2CRG7_9BACT|nr:MAG: exodeoxyribonuclease III [Candidatus Lloydbacteria bacterium RIFCSPHIGHO2_01_FULL_41_20]
MRLISWNVNGIRAVHKKGALDIFLKQKADIFCFQEIKADETQIPEETRNISGYFSYFASSKVKKGYSGVAVYTKEEPEKVIYGLGVKKFDDEGRLLELHFKDFIFFNVYFPNGGGGSERLAYKLEFYDAFLTHIEKIRKKGKSIIFCGDVNTAHEEIDLARPKENEENTGFLPEERAWIDELVYHGYVDTFRHFHPHKKDSYTYWDMKTMARERNVGWRIDYFFVSGDMIKKIKGAGIISDIYGSDHCPIFLDVNL